MKFLDGLDPEQQRAVALEAPAVCVLAGAGSGKTRVLTRRVARRIDDGSAAAAHTLVLTFTRKAANELRSRLFQARVGDEVVAGTFHSIAYAQLKHRHAQQGKEMPALSTNNARLLDAVLENLRFNRTLQSRPIAGEISWAKSHCLTPENYEAGLDQYRHRPPASVTQMVRIYEGYEWQKRKRKLMDFDDLLLVLTKALQTDRVFARAQAWRFRHFYIDEFQDLNRAQFALLQAWMQGAEADGISNDVFVVGDPNQSIYGWNGADPSLLQHIDKHLPGIELISLRTNYRSTSHVLAAAHSVLAADQRQQEGGETGVVPIIRECADEQEEAEVIARAVRAAHGQNRRWGDIAVLVRTNAQRAVIEAAFGRFSIPYQSTGGAAWLSTPDVRAVIDDLRQTASARLASRAPDVEELVRSLDVETTSYLPELTTAIRRCLEETPFITVADFLVWVDVTYRYDGPASGANATGAVAITTFHRAKGLEWPVVFIAGVEAGLVPYGAVDSMQLEEERRLFYVAITRAREEFHCSWARRRTASKGVSARTPSPWLEYLTRASQTVDSPTTSKRHALSLIEERRVELDRDELDPARVALERWRQAHAKLTGLPAQTILRDSVVDAIIDRRPRSVQELGTIDGIGPVRAAAIGEQLLHCLAVGVTSSRVDTEGDET